MAQKSESRDLEKVILRLPDGMRDQLKSVAETNQRSMNAEVVSRLQSSFQQAEDGAIRVLLPPDLLARVVNAAESRQENPNDLFIEAIEAAFPPPPTLAGILEAMADKIAFSNKKQSDEEEAFIAFVDDHIRAPREAAKPMPRGWKK